MRLKIRSSHCKSDGTPGVPGRECPVVPVRRYSGKGELSVLIGAGRNFLALRREFQEDISERLASAIQGLAGHSNGLDLRARLHLPECNAGCGGCDQGGDYPESHL